MFKDACTAEVFLNSRICKSGAAKCKDNEKIPNKMNVYCQKWAKIQELEDFLLYITKMTFQNGWIFRKLRTFLCKSETFFENRIFSHSENFHL